MPEDNETSNQTADFNGWSGCLELFFMRGDALSCQNSGSGEAYIQIRQAQE